MKHYGVGATRGRHDRQNAERDLCKKKKHGQTLFVFVSLQLDCVIATYRGKFAAHKRSFCPPSYTRDSSPTLSVFPVCPGLVSVS